MCPPLNQSPQEKWNHYDWLTLVSVSKASEGRKEPRVKDGEKEVCREGGQGWILCTGPGGKVTIVDPASPRFTLKPCTRKAKLISSCLGQALRSQTSVPPLFRVESPHIMVLDFSFTMVPKECTFHRKYTLKFELRSSPRL